MEKENYRTLVVFALMLVTIVMRAMAPLSPQFELIAGFSGLGAMALFGGTYLKNWFQALALPAIVLLLSDLALILTMGKSYAFYEGWYYTYAGLLVMAVLARLIVTRVNGGRVLLAMLSGVVAHWLITDFGVWFGSSFYPQTLAGFWTCLAAAIPFELNFLYSTLAYSAILFAVFEGLQVRFPALRRVNHHRTLSH